MESTPSREQKAEPNLGGLLVCALVGLWFVFGGAMSLYHGEWFPLFPPQIDLFALLGAQVGGATALLLGVALIAAAILLSTRRHDV